MFQLLESAQSGCEASIEKLCVLAEGVSTKVLTPKEWGAGRSSVEDIVQDTLYEVARDLAKCRAETLEEFEAWVSRIARNTASSAAKMRVAKKRGGEGVVQAELMDHHSSTHVTPLQQVIAKETLKAVLETIEAIDHSEDNRLVVERFLRGDAEKDIARELGRSETAVYGVIKRVRQKLQREGLSPTTSVSD